MTSTATITRVPLAEVADRVNEVLDNVDSIKSALVGAAATKFKGILGEVVPGFKEHLAKAEADRGRESTH